ncbi:MAG: hypothetical protein ACI85F_001642 [Bacteroidia bacterium]|jgi:hypothetical protein
MNRIPIIFAFILSGLGLQGQNTPVNLVPNGSFEAFSLCPIDNSGGGNLSSAIGWYDPIISTADFLHECAYPGGFGVPNGVDTNIFAADGSGMAYMFVFAGREYVAVKLEDTLENNKVYLFSMSLHLLSNQVVAIGSFGAYFSQDSATDYSNFQSVINVSPQLQRDPDSLMSNPDIWYHWEDTLVAQGFEQYLVIGNFLPDSLTPFYQPTWFPSSGYFIDNVRLTLIPDTLTSMAEPKRTFILAPNPALDQLRIDIASVDKPVIVRCLTMAGEEVFSLPFQKDMDVSSLPVGLYLIEVVFDDGRSGYKKFVKQGN